MSYRRKQLVPTLHTAAALFSRHTQLVLLLLFTLTLTSKWLQPPQYNPAQGANKLQDTALLAPHIDWELVQQTCSQHLHTGADNKLVLITGAAGFIGMHVAITMKQRGDIVIGIDNFNHYYDVALKRARQNNAKIEQGIFIVEGDVGDAELLNQLFKTCKFTHIVHLAAQPGVNYSLKKPLEYVNANILASVVLLEAVKDQNPAPAMIYASSSSVYGLNTKQPFSEEDSVDTPASIYAATKRSGELLAHTYHHLYQVDMTAVRFFTVYGPWGRPDMAYFKFAQSIVRNQEIQVYKTKDGEDLYRDFTFIDDIVNGVLGAVDTSSARNARYRIFNLSNSQLRNIKDLVDVLQQSLKVTARLKWAVVGAGEVIATHANVTKARDELGFEPKTSLEEGISKFAEWFLLYQDYAAA